MIIKHSDNGKLPLVLLHGWGLNSAVWDFILADLEQLFDVHRIDLPGFGFNNHKQLSRYDMDTLVALITPLCPPGCILAGWSLGGLVASQMALQHRERFSSLCLIASTPCFIRRPRWKGIKPEVLQQFANELGENSEKTISRFLAIQAMGSESARQDVKQLKQTLFKVGPALPQALSGGLAMLEEIDLRAQMPSLTLPVKGIFGRLDSLVALKSIEQMAGTLADFEYEVIAKASHAPFISHRSEFVAALKSFYLV
ncbi:MAG: pimeloyl-[acyl-carrier protein] methyl ester esterase [Phenylobacterium sp.]|jgi:pimeloyl-[acyl-carrier protein] methyl ester esterase